MSHVVVASGETPATRFAIREAAAHRMILEPDSSPSAEAMTDGKVAAKIVS